MQNARVKAEIYQCLHRFRNYVRTKGKNESFVMIRPIKQKTTVYWTGHSFGYESSMFTVVSLGILHNGEDKELCQRFKVVRRERERERERERDPHRHLHKHSFAPFVSYLETTKSASEKHHPGSEAWKKAMKKVQSALCSDCASENGTDSFCDPGQIGRSAQVWAA